MYYSKRDLHYKTAIEISDIAPSYNDSNSTGNPFSINSQLELTSPVFTVPVL